MDRTAIFIDGGHLDKLLEKHFLMARIDYHLLAERMAGGKEILRTYYYHCLPYKGSPPTQEENDRFSNKNRFFNTLSRLPRFDVRLGRLAYRGQRSDGNPIFEQKMVDIKFGVDLVKLTATGKIGQAVILAGDSDFVPAIDVAKQDGVLVILWHGPQGTFHNELWTACDERHEITMDFINQIVRQ